MFQSCEAVSQREEEKKGVNEKKAPAPNLLQKSKNFPAENDGKTKCQGSGKPLDPDQMPKSLASDLGQHCVLRIKPVCPRVIIVTSISPININF